MKVCKSLWQTNNVVDIKLNESRIIIIRYIICCTLHITKAVKSYINIFLNKGTISNLVFWTIKDIYKIRCCPRFGIKIYQYFSIVYNLGRRTKIIFLSRRRWSQLEPMQCLISLVKMDFCRNILSFCLQKKEINCCDVNCIFVARDAQVAWSTPVWILSLVVYKIDTNWTGENGRKPGVTHSPVMMINYEQQAKTERLISSDGQAGTYQSHFMSRPCGNLNISWMIASIK